MSPEYAQAGAPYGVYRFRARGEVDAALSSPETERVMADVKNFTCATVIIRSIFDPL